MSLEQKTRVGAGGDGTYAYVVAKIVGGGIMVNGIIVPPGGPSSDELNAAIANLCAKDAAMCRMAFSCDSFDSAQCFEVWQQSLPSLFKNLFANKYGDAYDDKLYGPLSQYIGDNLVDFGLALGTAHLLLKGAGGKPAGNSVWDEFFKSQSCGNSFDPETRVLLADGTTKKIKDVQVGDHVLATDPRTDKTEAKPVTDLHENLDAELTLITATDGFVTNDIDTTWEHPFWSETRNEWVLA